MRLAEHIVVETVDGNTVLLDLNQNTYFALNSVGRIIIDSIADGLSTDAIQSLVCSSFPNQSSEQIANDIDEFLAHLESQEMLIVS